MKNSTSERKSQIEQIRKEAEALAFFVDKSPRNLPSFIKKLSENPRATRAALVDLLVQTHNPDYRGKPNVPGAWMNNVYKRYNCLDPNISDEVMHWLDSDATWQEIDETLRLEAEQRARPPAANNSGAQPLADTVSSRQAVAETTCDQAVKLTAVPLDINKTWMNEAEAHTLAQQIVLDGATHDYVITTEVAPDHAVWLVRINWDGNILAITSPAHWRSEFAEIYSMLQARLRIPA
ncbi:hypothetical protein KDA_70010 [Dictyobacter alpinus]|uniref:Uncharacterized protein n=1 Tax=Dictyobacter alpinus TaxID=2014873 RepID=A0A402BJJ3_9CHLR|nr:hypothetical protein [Dictyobacter alpinus]GCE31517.1 hypothetical protein KDA_70010 [Dictyobacter alpinus]